MTAAALPVPGPSYIREEPVRLRDRGSRPERTLTAGMTRPQQDDGWWLFTLWAADADGVVEASEIAPVSGPPPGTPLQAIGPRLAGGLAGLLAEADGRQQIRLRMPPPADESTPWARPLVMWVALAWDPVRAATQQPNMLARELLRAFAHAIDAVGSPA